MSVTEVRPRKTRKTAPAKRRRPAPPTAPKNGVWDGAPLTCQWVRDEAPSVKTFALAPQDGSRIRYHAGQNITLAWSMPDGEVLHRTFTIASSPASGGPIELTIKAHPGGRVTNDMHARLVPGETVSASGVGGRFGLAFHPAQKVLFVGAGSGLTPMMAMIRLIRDRGHDVDVTLLQCARTPADLLFTEELAALTAALPNLSALNIVDAVPPGTSFLGPRGRLTRPLLHALVPDARMRETFLCGPTPFMAALTRALRAEGCDPAHVHTEAFTAETPAPPPAARTGAHHTLTLARSGKTLEIAANETLLSALGKAGVPAKSGCRLGLCGTCRVARLAGDVAMTHQGGLDPSHEAAGDVLTCCSYATGPVTLDL